MAQLKRHIGKLKNTDRRIVVVYMSIPGKEKSALIVDTDALPDQFHEFLMNVVESEAGQRSVNLADVLDRRASPDSGLNLMNSLHRRGFMRPEPVDNIIMFPRPNMPFPLSQVIELMKKDEPSSINETQTPVKGPEARYNQFTENQNFDDKQQSLDVAKSILYDAELLQQDVNRKRAKAYEIAPSLRPKGEPQFLNRGNLPAADAQSSLLPVPQIDSIDQAREYQEIIARAQEHLDRSVYREEHGETPHFSDPMLENTIVVKKKPAPKARRKAMPG